MRRWTPPVLGVFAWLASSGSSCDSEKLPYVSPLCESAEPDACARHSDCSDGIFCNGEERCAPGNSGADDCGCIRAPDVACPGIDQACEEDVDACYTVCPVTNDADGDGHDATSCGGDDCDDSDVNRYPGNAEVCDADGHDEDCDPSTPGYRDEDEDGFSDADCTNVIGGDVRSQGVDCDDSDPSVHPIQNEVCNGVDDDCDADVDEGLTVGHYRDEDSDGFGTGSPEERCAGTTGWALYAGDCDDSNPAIEPGALRCQNLQDAQAYELCQSDGTWAGGQCPDGEVCLPQPNGTGVCEIP